MPSGDGDARCRDIPGRRRGAEVANIANFYTYPPGDLAKKTGDVAKTVGDVAKTVGDVAKTVGDVAKTVGDVANSGGSLSPTATGDPA